MAKSALLPSLVVLAAITGCLVPRTPTRPDPEDPVAFHEVCFTVGAPRDEFVRAFLAAPLERFIKGTKALPGVARTEPMTELAFPAVGSVRRVVLRDGNTAREEVLASDNERLRYFVTDYTSPQAKPIEWGLGEFAFEPEGETTRVRWRYSFKLRGDRFPGWLGPIGRHLFRTRFLEGDYAEFMAAQVAEIQAFAANEVPR